MGDCGLVSRGVRTDMGMIVSEQKGGMVIGNGPRGMFWIFERSRLDWVRLFYQESAALATQVLGGFLSFCADISCSGRLLFGHQTHIERIDVF